MVTTRFAKLIDLYHSFYERKVPLSEHRAVLKCGADLARKNKALELQAASLNRALEACEDDRRERVNALDDANRENERLRSRIADAVASLQS
jgi:hypothetical protein